MLPCSLPWEVLESGSLQSMRTGDTSWSRAGSSPLLHLKTRWSSSIAMALSSDSEKLDHQILHHLIQREFRTDGDDFFLLWECFKHK